jgi:uncharacterized membrane protein
MRETSAPSSLLWLLHRHGLLPALLGSVAAEGLLAWRLDWSQRASYLYLTWNLALAWAPYLLALGARLRMERGGGWGLLPLGAAWLVTFPNAPYLLTDFIHLRARHGVPLWFDAALLALFAATGWLLGLLSLEVWKQWLEARLGRVGAWAGVGLVSALSGYGIYLGRVERWNSWDVLAEPGALLEAVGSHLRAPGEHPELVGLTGLFAALVLLSYVAFEVGLRRPAEALTPGGPRPPAAARA